MSQHAREHPELYEEAEERVRELSWGRCAARRCVGPLSSSETPMTLQCELDAPHPREQHIDEQGGHWS